MLVLMMGLENVGDGDIQVVSGDELFRVEFWSDKYLHVSGRVGLKVRLRTANRASTGTVSGIGLGSGIRNYNLPKSNESPSLKLPDDHISMLDTLISDTHRL